LGEERLCFVCKRFWVGDVRSARQAAKQASAGWFRPSVCPSALALLLCAACRAAPPQRAVRRRRRFVSFSSPSRHFASYGWTSPFTRLIVGE